MVTPKNPDTPEYKKLEQNQNIAPNNESKPDTEAFQAYMNEPQTENTEKVSPMELAQKQQNNILPTTQSLLTQISASTDKLSSINSNLNTPKLSIKDSHKQLLDSKLKASNQHIQKASNYLGANAVSPTTVSEGASPVAKFLGYVTDGQNQLLEAKRKLQDIQAKGGELKPSEMMLVQINLSQAQQELEFSSTLLSKVVDSLKQILSTQL